MRRWHRAQLVTATALVVLAALLGCTPPDRPPEPGPTVAPPLEGAPRVHLTAAGDYGADPATTGRVLDGIRAASPDAHLALGDLSYGRTGQEEEWCRFVRSRVGDGIPFQLVPGNHESNGDNGRIDAFAQCLPNQLRGLTGTYPRQWYVDLPQASPVVRVVMISPAITFPDGTWDYSKGSPHYEWTSAAISGARAARIPFVVVGMHRPCLSMGRYACDVGTDLLQLLVSERVDLVLTGHEHLYQRTDQLAVQTGCPAVPAGRYEPACVADSDGSLVAGAGTVFVTVGTGGIPLRAVNAADPEAGYFAASSGSNHDPTYGHVDLTVTPAGLRMEFVGDAGGSFSDVVTMRRPAASLAAQPTPSSTAGG